MKLAPLLAQYLYANKRLDLPGIGSFSVDTLLHQDSESSRQSPESIHFESNPSARESADLIAYISAQTGKMKALAAADFNSHLELVHEFLNIGKPFLLEGIGSLAKQRSGAYSFSGIAVPAEKIKDQHVKEVVNTSASDDSFDPLLGKKTFIFDWRKPAVAGMIFLGTALAIWGGYSVYKRSKGPEAAEVAPTPLVASYVADSLDSVENAKKVEEPVRQPAGFKFVLETANKNRAYARYKTLKGYDWNIQMETKDSVKYKLFVQFATADTSKALDSLTALNGRKVYIEGY